MSTFKRIVTITVGDTEDAFSVHADLLAAQSVYFKAALHNDPRRKAFELHSSSAKSFHLFASFIHGGGIALSYANEEQRRLLVDAYVLGDLILATSFKDKIMNIMIRDATRPRQPKILPGLDCIMRAYESEVTDERSALRRFFVDLYVHFCTPDDLNALMNKPQYPRDFLLDYCSRARVRDDHDMLAREYHTELMRFNDQAYYNRNGTLTTPEPATLTRPGLKAFNTIFNGVHTLIIDDGKLPLYVHRQLVDLPEDGWHKRPPREIHFPDGWREPVEIFLKWLYNGGVKHECYTLTSFVRAYRIGLDFNTVAFLNDLMDAIISWCVRYFYVPSPEDIAQAYLAAPAGTPLRQFMLSWTLTHKAITPFDTADLPAALCEQVQHDLDLEHRARTAAIRQDVEESAAHHEYGYVHPRLWADEGFIDERGIAAAPYYGDTLCKYHFHDEPSAPGSAKSECNSFGRQRASLPNIVIGYIPQGLPAEQGWGGGAIYSTAGLFHSRKLQGGWEQRRCADGRAYFIKLVPGQPAQVTSVDPRAYDWTRGREGNPEEEPVGLARLDLNGDDDV